MPEGEQVGSMYIDFGADIVDMKNALFEIRTQLKETGFEAKRATGSFDVMGMVMQGSIIATAIKATDALGGFVGGLLDFASASPDVAMATADLNYQLFTMAEDIGPEAGRVISGLTDLLKTMWPDVKPALEGLLDFFSDDLIPIVKEAWELLTAPPEEKEKKIEDIGKSVREFFFGPEEEKRVPEWELPTSDIRDLEKEAPGLFEKRETGFVRAVDWLNEMAREVSPVSGERVSEVFGGAGAFTRGLVGEENVMSQFFFMLSDFFEKWKPIGWGGGENA